MPTEPSTKRAYQNALMTVQKASGDTVEALAERWGLTAGTIRRRLGEAEASGFTPALQEAVDEKFIPLALAVYERKLTEGDLGAARDVLFGRGVLEKLPRATRVATLIEQEPSSLAEWQESRRARSSYQSFKEPS